MNEKHPSVLYSTRLAAHGFTHGFSTRVGGVSSEPFDSLNLGWGIEASNACIRKNREIFFRQLEINEKHIFEVSQVHSNRAVMLREEDQLQDVRSIEADALISPSKNQAVAVRTADCVPILCADPKTGVVAAIHAGWRGCVSKIIDQTFQILRKDFDLSPDVIAAVGPHISKKAFQIGPELVSQFESCSSAQNVVDKTDHGYFADLTSIVFAQLKKAGVQEENIEKVGGCTFQNPELFYSYRRDGKKAGRHLAVIHPTSL